MIIKALGPVEVERDGVMVNVGGKQQRRLLALLVVNRGRSVSTDRLVDAMWPDGDAPEGSARSMRTYLSRLRAVMPEGSIAKSHGGYSLRSDNHCVDIDRFDDLLAEAELAVPDCALGKYDDAIALWRGVPFGEFTDEWWAVAESSRLLERRALADEGRATMLMALGHHNRAIPELERLVAEYPLREQSVRLLMQSLQVTGRRAESLRVSRAFRARLGEETGLDPSADLAKLEFAIASDDEPSAAAYDRPLRGYTMHQAIGEGAYGRVYAATQPGTERPVALKAIRPELADSPEFVRRFDSEARLVARLEHPHIVALYDYWREPGGAYLVFRFLPGGTARDSVISGGPWSFKRVSRFVEEIAGALMSAHAAGVVHNDVKTSNVLLDDDGAAYLTDFGIATADRESAEQGVRADVSGLSWMVWELLSGSRPPTDLSRSHAHFGEDRAMPRLLGLVAGALPEGLDAVLSSGSASRGGYASAAEFLLAWRAATGRPDGELSPIASDERHAADSARRHAARALARSAAAGINPYRGLRPFDVEDSTSFCGRSKAIEDLLAIVGRTCFATVIGASGSGKSSLVRAGLVPRLRSLGYGVVTMTPGDDPLGAFNVAVGELATVSDLHEASEPIDALAAVARRFGRIVVVVDQLEECWTRAPEPRREMFLDLVARTIDDESVDVRFVATVRADLTDRPLEHHTLGHLVGSGAYVLSAPSPAELDEAIVVPAAQAGVHFDEAVVADLIAEAVTQPGSLPLLQFTLAELYDRRVDGTITHDALESMGGMAGAIGRRAEDLHANLDDQSKADVRQLFARLVAPGGGAADTRRRARRSELSDAMISMADRYVDARLLTTDRDPVTREPTVELAHEALLTRWSRFAGWVEEDRRWLSQLDHLSAAAQAWHTNGRDDHELYRGARLEAAIEAIDVDGRPVSTVEREFVEAGRMSRDSEVISARTTARRLRRRLTAVAVMLVLALTAGTLAIVQRSDARQAADEARTAEDRANTAADDARTAEGEAIAAADRALAAEATAQNAADASAAAERAAQVEALVGRAESLRSTQRDVAALLAVEAHRLADTPRTRSALFGTFTDNERFLDAHTLPGERGTSGIVMPDGIAAFVADQDGRIHPYDLDTGVLADPLPAIGGGDHRPVLAASSDAVRLAVASKDDPIVGPTTVGVFDVQTGNLVFDPVVVDDAVTSMVFLPDGRIALGMGEDGRLAVIDGSTGDVVGEVSGVAIEPDEVIWATEPSLRRPTALALSGEELLVGAADGTLRLLDAESLETRNTLLLEEQTLSNLWPLGDGTVVTSGRFGLARVDLDRGTNRWAHAGLNRCIDLHVVEAQGVLYCGDPYGRLDEIDLEGAVLRRLDLQNGGSGSLWTARGGTELVAFGSSEPVVSRWRLDGSGPITTLVTPGWTPKAFNQSGELLLLDGGDSPVGAGVVDLEDPSAVVPVDGLIAASWNDDHSLLGMASGPEELEWATIDLGAGAEPALSGIVIGYPPPAANDHDTGKERMLLRYKLDEKNSLNVLSSLDPVTWQLGPTIPIVGLVSWAISRTGDRIAAGTTRGVEVYDGDTGEEFGTIPIDDLRGVFISPADQLFVSSLGGELTQYDLATLEPVRSFGGSRGLVFSLSGTGDGSLIAASGGDQRVSVFDVASGVQLGRPIDMTADERNFVALSHDGRWLVFGGQPNGNDGPEWEDAEDKAGQMWNLDPESWTAAACRLAGRNLTPAEWSSFIGGLAPYRPTC
jgi:DNA-binding SARP family transcriptional activator/WD40 repeat protein